MQYDYRDALTGSEVSFAEQASDASVRPSREDMPQATSIFFPGCSLINYAMPLCAAVYDTLREIGEVDGISLLCCGRILSFEEDGDHLRKVNDAQMIEHLVRSSVARIVTACPNCTKALRAILQEDERTASIELVALPRLLADRGYAIDGATAAELILGDADAPLVLSPHDSCPDRDWGDYASGLRDLLPAGYRDPKHNRNHSLCCGSLMRAANRPEEADKLARRNGEEAVEVGAHAIVTACMSCAFQLNVAQDLVPVVHFLELLYQWRVDWASAPWWMKLRFLFDETDREAQRERLRRDRLYAGLGGDVYEAEDEELLELLEEGEQEE